MFKVDAPARISTPGQSISGADGVGERGWVTPGFALENMLVNRLVHELSDVDPTLEAEEQPASAMPPNSSAAALQLPQTRSFWDPGPIEITRLFVALPPRVMVITAKPWRSQGRNRPGHRYQVVPSQNPARCPLRFKGERAAPQHQGATSALPGRAMHGSVHFLMT